MTSSGLNLILITIILAVLTDNIILAQRISTEPAGKIILREGQRQDLLCRSGQPFQYCRFEIPNEKVIVLSESSNKHDNFKYYGEGLDRGQCGVTIFSVQGKHNGKVKCSGAIDGDEVAGTFDLEIALSPKDPELQVGRADNPDLSYNADSRLLAQCVVADGRPAARIHWFLNEMPINSGLGPENITTHIDQSRGIELMTISQVIEKPIQPEDDGKFLICRAEHEANQRDDLKEAKYQIRVRYPPMKRRNLMVYGLTLDRTNTINVTVRSNPRPRIQWTIDGVDVQEGRQVGRYSAPEPREIGTNEYNVTLTIAGLTLEDTMKTYHLRASNELGLTEYDVQISSAGSPASDGLDIGAIVGIVLALLVVLIIISLVIFAKATNRWCFGAKSKTATSETSDTESAVIKEKQNKSKRLPTLAAIFKKRSEKHSKDQKKEEDDEQRLASPNGDNKETEGDGNDNDLKEDKQLVYAELVLKPADEKAAAQQQQQQQQPQQQQQQQKHPQVHQPVTNKNATEYAEIVYVQKPPGSKDEPPKENKK